MTSSKETKMRCKGCKHWAHQDIRSAWGFCTRISTHWHPDNHLESIKAGNSFAMAKAEPSDAEENGMLFVTEGFSCILWEKAKVKTYEFT